MDEWQFRLLYEEKEGESLKSSAALIREAQNSDINVIIAPIRNSPGFRDPYANFMVMQRTSRPLRKISNVTLAARARRTAFYLTRTNARFYESCATHYEP